jgi:hypothetical protein
MAWHLAAWRQSIDSATLTELDVVPDDVLTRSGTKRFLVPSDYRFVQFAMATGPNVTDARIRTPSLGVRRMDLNIVPRRRGGESLTLAVLEIMRPPRPVMLTPTEEISAVAAEDGTGATVVNVLVALGAETLPPAPPGDVRVVRFLGSTTLTPGVWTTVTVTPEFSLEPGSYTLVGFLPISAGCIAARVLFVGGTYRPGYPGLAGTEAVALNFDFANLTPFFGVALGSFTHITIPQFQYLSTSADTVQVIYAYVVKTA